MRRIVIVLLTCVLALWGAVSPPAHAGDVQRPFKITFVGGTTDITWAPGFDFATNPWATSTFGGRCPQGASWLIENGGTGSGTYLGEFQWTSLHCTLITSLDPPNALIYAGELTFTADNGDLLYEDYTPASGIVIVGDQMCADTAATFAGGTGRFTNASGSALEHGCWPISMSPVLTDLTVRSLGTITFDASDQRTVRS